ncbi:hypothetical protein [Fructobacillus ficulneus]|uniref:Sensor histidine kinase n=1 Tax=Fructobacillus ficulneus TaxID=157463 RepID=A0A0K8MIF6_9LACO|nr:hypothetical protein [Fructobacillus ficulneus]GAO99659.1 sensor histidine kinase [Fructobacillus ficulneus]
MKNTRGPKLDAPSYTCREWPLTSVIGLKGKDYSKIITNSGGTTVTRPLFVFGLFLFELLKETA